MKPGQHNKHVTLWRGPQVPGDADGFFEALSPKDWWCSIQPLEPSLSDGTRSTLHRVTGRYHSGITVDTRILYGTRELFVKGVQNVEDKGRELVLLCEEISA